MTRKRGWPKRRSMPLPPRRVIGARAVKRNGAPPAVRLTIPIREAALMVGINWRTLRKLLEDDPCLVFLAGRYKVDMKGFAKWCRAQGIKTSLDPVTVARRLGVGPS